MQGAVTQGIGLAMIEYFDWYNGTPTDPQLKDYPIPGAAMMPKLHVAFADSYEPSGPFGAKGLGEIGLDAMPAAIANAIADAVGVRIHESADHRGEDSSRAAPGAVRGRRRPPRPPRRKAATWTRLAAGSPPGARPLAAESSFPQRASRKRSALLAAGDATLVCGGMSHALRRERTGFPFAKRLVAITRIAELKRDLASTPRRAAHGRGRAPAGALRRTRACAGAGTRSRTRSRPSATRASAA